MICIFRCIQTIGESMGSETSWSTIEYEEQFKEKNDLLKKQQLNQYRSNANIYVGLMCLLYKGSDPGSCVPLVPNELRINMQIRIITIYNILVNYSL